MEKDIREAMNRLASSDFSEVSDYDFKAALYVMGNADEAVDYLKRLKNGSPDIAALCMDGAVSMICKNLHSVWEMVSGKLKKW